MMDREGARLVQPSIALESEYLSMAEEFWAKESWVAGENRFQNDRDLIENSFSAYIRRLDEENQSIRLKPGYVPSTTFWLAANNTQIIGESRLRHWLTTSLEHEGGHIGYVIRPSERRKGYGTCILALTLEKARDLGLNRVLLTCDTDNIGSARIIEQNGGKLENQEISNSSGKPISRYWIDL
jgi:predicted acetyltransferase